MTMPEPLPEAAPLVSEQDAPIYWAIVQVDAAIERINEILDRVDDGAR